jgi:hypothetical protein
VKRDKTVSFEFVETVPAHLKEETIYVSIRYATAVHKCFCGCGNEVVTPLSPTDWAVTFDGESVSLDPSVGSWNLPCRSHYWIDRNRVKWAPRWSRERIRIGRAADSFAKATYYNEQAIRNVAGNPELIRKKVPTPRERVWSAITRWWRKNDSDHR